jgi:hypothetical protein
MELMSSPNPLQTSTIASSSVAQNLDATTTKAIAAAQTTQPDGMAQSTATVAQPPEVAIETEPDETSTEGPPSSIRPDLTSSQPSTSTASPESNTQAKTKKTTTRNPALPKVATTLTPIQQERKTEQELEKVVAEVIQRAIQESVAESIADSIDLGLGGGGGTDTGGVVASPVVDVGGGVVRQPQAAVAGQPAAQGNPFPQLPAQGGFGGLPGQVVQTTPTPLPPPEPDQSAIVATLKDSLPLIIGALEDESIQEVGVTAEETFLSCHYDKKDCDISHFKTFVDRRYGNCFIFNWNGTRIVSRSSKDHGFFVQMNVQRDQYMSLTESVGMRVALHEPGVIPVPYSNGFNVAAGYSSLFELGYSEIINVGEPYAPCVGAPNRTEFLLEGNYSLDGCLESCMQEAIADQCNCADPTKPTLATRPNLTRCDLVRSELPIAGHFGNARSCSFAEKCLDVFLASDKALKNPHCAKCAFPCRYGTYQRTQTQVVWPHANEVSQMCAICLTQHYNCLLPDRLELRWDVHR